MTKSLPEGLNYCRRCEKLLPEGKFYEAVDCGFVDANGKMSVCKNCIQDMYDEVFEELNSMEKTIHKLCTSLNIRYSNEAVSAARTHINTLLEQGKNVNAIFGIYKMKLTSVKKSMDKSQEVDQTYEDVATIYTHEQIDTDEIPIPQEVIDFWGNDIKREDILYLEKEYANFKQTHKADTYSEIVLLKQVCYTMLDIKKERLEEDHDTQKLVKELQDLMKNLAITPKETSSKTESSGEQAWGMWIKDIEEKEPAQWLSTDPRGDMYRDVGNVDLYFKNYIVKPLKNFILMSKDFSIDEEMDNDDDYLLEYEEQVEYDDIPELEED